MIEPVFHTAIRRLVDYEFDVRAQLNDFFVEAHKSVSGSRRPVIYASRVKPYFQTGKATAFVSLCKYEPFRDSLGESSIATQKECIRYIINFEE